MKVAAKSKTQTKTKPSQNLQNSTTSNTKPPPLEKQPQFPQKKPQPVKMEIVYDSGEETETEDLYVPQTLPVNHKIPKNSRDISQPQNNFQEDNSQLIQENFETKIESSVSLIPNEITLESYLKLYEQKLRLEHEVIQLKNKLFEAQIKLENNVVNKPNATELKDKLIDLLLESPLNIESIPDDVERQIYRFILEQLDTGVQVATKCCVIM
jgi:hypothetical protein